MNCLLRILFGVVVWSSWMGVLPSDHLAVAAADAPVETTLVSDGQAQMPVIVASQAAPETRQAAAKLAEYLGKLSGGRFEVREGDGTSGMAVGTADDFPSLGLTGVFDPSDPMRREDYVLRSHSAGMYLVGATKLAARHAVYDLLYRLGYRQFFPSPHWEVVPHRPTLQIAVDAVEHPDYCVRRIWRFGGPSDDSYGPYEDWCAKNRVGAGIDLWQGHAAGYIIAPNKAQFDAHPEYFALVDGQRTSKKFCLSNPGLRQLVIDDAERQLTVDPTFECISVEPCDNEDDWCQCEACMKLGPKTDRILGLANEVATAVTAKHPEKFVGLLAYTYHAPPPSFSAHPRVILSVTTQLDKGGYTLDERLDGWRAKTKLLGVYDYFGVPHWSLNQPGKARGGDLAYLKRAIPHYYAKGARFFSAEAGEDAGPNGLGYYLASRMLWNVSEAKRIDELVDEFLTLAFGRAKEPMREFYRQLDGSLPHLVVADQVGRMFRSLQKARELADSEAVRTRLDDLLLYAHFVDLYQRYVAEEGASRQPPFEAFLRHTYRMRGTLLVHSNALFAGPDNIGPFLRDKSVTVPPEARWDVPEGKNPWKSSEPFAAEELARFLAEGIERYPLTQIDFRPVEFGRDLVPASRLRLPNVAAGALTPGRGTQSFLTRIDEAPAALELRITTGMIESQARCNARVALWKLDDDGPDGPRETLITDDRSVPPDRKEHIVWLIAREPGLYKVTVDDDGNQTLVDWRSALPWTIKSSRDEPMHENFVAPWSLYFYVPKGVKTVDLFGGDHGEVCDSAGRPVLSLEGREANYHRIDVPSGEDGRLWSVRGGREPIRLLSVPPYFARTAAELLLPAEVVARDAVDPQEHR